MTRYEKQNFLCIYSCQCNKCYYNKKRKEQCECTRYSFYFERKKDCIWSFRRDCPGRTTEEQKIQQIKKEVFLYFNIFLSILFWLSVLMYNIFILIQKTN